jgi:hypothetical protein
VGLLKCGVATISAKCCVFNTVKLVMAACVLNAQTCCFWVTTLMGISAMFEVFLWKDLRHVTRVTSAGGKHELSSRAT